jgi:hypothetical protein
LDFSLYPSTMETCFANNEGYFLITSPHPYDLSRYPP